MHRTILICFIYLGFIFHAHGQIMIDIPTPNTKEIVENRLIQNIGYPFDDQKYLMLSRDLISIAEQINQYSKRVDFNSENQRIGFTIQQFTLMMDRTNDTRSSITENYGAFSEHSIIDPDKIFSTLILAGHYGDIEPIEPFLEYSLKYIGREWQAYEHPMFIFSISEQFSTVKLTNEERLCHWPAANAIIKNPTVAIPLLVDYVLAPQNEESLRYRAIGFLQELAPELLKEEVMPNVSSEMVTHIKCILAGQFSWREANSRACDMLFKMQMKRERIIPSRQKLADDIEKRERENEQQ